MAGKFNKRKILCLSGHVVPKFQKSPRESFTQLTWADESEATGHLRGTKRGKQVLCDRKCRMFSFQVLSPLPHTVMQKD